MTKKLLTLGLACLASISLTSCSKKTQSSYDGINLHYISSDDKMTTFLNDFTHRNMRYDNDACGEFEVAHGTGFAKNWEAMAVTFQNSIKQVYREDKIEKIAEYLIQITQDDQGLIDNTPLVNEPAFSEADNHPSGFSVPQGWPFPCWQNSVNNFLDKGSLEAVHTTEFDFNDSGHPQSQEWHVNNGMFRVGNALGENTGYAEFETTNASTNQYLAAGTDFSFYRNKLDTLLPFMDGIDTRCAPMIDIEIAFDGSNSNIKDYNIIFKVAGDDNWYVAPQSVYASDPITYFDTAIHTRQFLDMYLHPNWNRQIVTEIGVQFVGLDGKAFRVKNGRINFIRPTYDTRQANATYQFILAVCTYFSFTRDMKTLMKLMPKVRKGMLFLNHCLEGEKGLLSLEYLYGHDGVVPYSIDKTDRLPYHGIGNGYGDLTVAPMYNLEANTYYYQALRGVATLEEAMKDVKDDNPSKISIKNRLPNKERVYYTWTSESLNALADTVKANMEKPIDVRPMTFDYTYNAGDYYYQNFGGFYNPKTGRLAIGISEYDGRIIDYGHVYLNLEAVCAGIGTPEQQLSIMQWIDGQRNVEGDRSQGKDIYFYEFAPRFNTRDCDREGGCYGFVQDENFHYRFYQYGYDTWSRQVQNGGAVIAWSYYDLVARARVLGIDNAQKRLEEIKKWYLKVLDYGGNGLAFYDDYYDNLDAEATMADPDMYYVYSVQDCNNRGGGAVGLDAEFIESIIFIRSISDALFGMDARQNNVLSFTYNNLKSSFFEIYNMKYGDAVYSIRCQKNSLEVFNINGLVDVNHKLSFKYKTDKTNLTVKVNGEKYQDVQYVDGYAVVTVPFANVKVIFG